jgi:hypothetical protein
VLRRLAAEDPDLVAAVADVDRSQIRDNLDRTPAERLQAAFSLAETLSGFLAVQSVEPPHRGTPLPCVSASASTEWIQDTKHPAGRQRVGGGARPGRRPEGRLAEGAARP